MVVGGAVVDVALELRSQQVPLSVPTTHEAPAQRILAGLVFRVYPVPHVSVLHAALASQQVLVSAEFAAAVSHVKPAQ